MNEWMNELFEEWKNHSFIPSSPNAIDTLESDNFWFWYNYPQILQKRVPMFKEISAAQENIEADEVRFRRF